MSIYLHRMNFVHINIYKNGPVLAGDVNISKTISPHILF